MSLGPLYTGDFVALKDTDTVGDAAAQMLKHRVTEHFRFATYLKIAFPVMLISILLSHLYLLLRYL